jgi:hypothetical protein
MQHGRRFIVLLFLMKQSYFEQINFEKRRGLDIPKGLFYI